LWDGQLPLTTPLTAFEMQSVGPSDVLQLTAQLIVPDSKQDLAFLSFVKHLFFQAEEGSLEHYLKNSLKVHSFQFDTYNEFMSVQLLLVSFTVGEDAIKDSTQLQQMVSAYYE